MDEQTRQRLEYEEQIFGFPSRFFCDSFKGFAISEIETSIDMLTKNIKKKLLNETRNQEIFKDSIKEMNIILKQEYNKSLETEMKNISDQICTFMNIPDHVLLKEDFPVRTGLTVDQAKIDSDINTLKGKCRAMCYLKKQIHEEIQIAESIIMYFESIIDEKTYNFKILSANETTELTKSNLTLAINPK